MALLLVVFRRLLLIPSALLAGFLGLAAFSYMGDFFFRLCPPEWLEDLGSELDLIGGDYACVAPWFPVAEAFTIFVGAAVASSLFVLLPALLEPTEHFFVAVMAYGVGAILTAPLLLLGVFSPTLLLTVPFLLSVGLGCVWLVKRWSGTGQKAIALLPKRLPR